MVRGEKRSIKSNYGSMSIQWDRLELASGFENFPILHTEPGVNVTLSANDLYVCDQESWHQIRGLLILLEDINVKHCSGISTVCLLLSNDECRCTWTLHQPSSLYSSGEIHTEFGDRNGFRWFYLPHRCRQLIKSYVLCQSLYIRNMNCMSTVLSISECSISSPRYVNLNMVVKATRDLEFYTSQCLHLPFADIKDSAKCGNYVFKASSFSEYPLLIVPVPIMVGRKIYACYPEINCCIQAHFSLNASTTSERSFTAGESIMPTMDINIDEVDMKCFKTESHLDDVSKEGEQPKHQHTQKPTQEASKITDKRMVLKFEKLLEIAKTYAALYCSRDIDHVRFPFGDIRGSTLIIECPKCNAPCNCSSPSAFLTLLRHVSRRHSHCFSALLADIFKRYAPLIDYMRGKIAYKSKKQYVNKLRKRRREVMQDNCVN